MAQMEYATDGPLVELARQIGGFSDGSDLIKHAAEEREPTNEKNPVPDYARRRGVDTTTHIGATKC